MHRLISPISHRPAKTKAPPQNFRGRDILRNPSYELPNDAPMSRAKEVWQVRMTETKRSALEREGDLKARNLPPKVDQESKPAAPISRGVTAACGRLGALEETTHR